MIDYLFSNPLLFFSWLIALVVAITVHEFSHALVADKLGDPTPRLQGRLTLNPLAHLDPVGTMMLLLVRFGWGKPVQFDPFNLRNPKKDAALISIAGPISNLITATVLSLIIRLTITPPFLLTLILPVIFLNVVLAIFNLIPINPLDGFKIVGGLLPDDQAREWQTLERYGFLFLLLLILPFNGHSLIGTIIEPIVSFIIKILLGPLNFYY